jgi:molybdenum cofactor sulfurtransferase
MASPGIFDPFGQAQAEAAFLEADPSFAETAIVEELRATEYGRLDGSGEVYLDYTGGGLYAASQLEQHMDLLRHAVFGNPHSVNPTSSAATVLVDQARVAVLRYFSAPEERTPWIVYPQDIPFDAALAVGSTWRAMASPR